jgi:ADP-ribose pyrophosphatase
MRDAFSVALGALLLIAIFGSLTALGLGFVRSFWALYRAGRTIAVPRLEVEQSAKERPVPTYDDDACLRRYFDLRKTRSDLFENGPGCPTRILVDIADIRQAQGYVREERERDGVMTSDLRVGLLAEDHYIGLVVRDAVKFSDGRFGLYNRIVTTGGIVVLPILEGAIALIRIFRHAPRRWLLEAPQGLLLPGDDPMEQARRELIEEMGAPATELQNLGTMYTSTAMTSENLKLFAARISNIGAPQLTEGIDSIQVIASDNIDALLMDGTICDGPTTAAITRARIRGFL